MIEKYDDDNFLNETQTKPVKNIWNSPKQSTNNLSIQATYNSLVKLRLFTEL